MAGTLENTERLKKKKRKQKNECLINLCLPFSLERYHCYYHHFMSEWKSVSFQRNDICCCYFDFGEAMQAIDTVATKRRNKVMDKSELANVNNMNKCAW